jgi:hypothetical protein
MNFNLEIVAGSIFTVDRQDTCTKSLDAICVDFKVVLLQSENCSEYQTKGKSGQRDGPGYSSPEKYPDSPY